jgi:hypothetical protein
MNSHDVRRLRVCCLCQELGIHRPNNIGTNFSLVICIHTTNVPNRERKYAHPNCYVKEMGVGKLLALPRAELDEIRLCDVPVGVMRKLVNTPSNTCKRKNEKRVKRGTT